MSLIDTFRYSKTTGVYTFGEVDVLPALQSTSTVHVEFDFVWEVEVEVEGMDYGADEVFEPCLGDDAFARIDFVMFVEDVLWGYGGGCEVTNGIFRVWLKIFDGWFKGDGGYVGGGSVVSAALCEGNHYFD